MIDFMCGLKRQCSEVATNTHEKYNSEKRTSSQLNQRA